ncbi:MAG: PEPxxWA-CTERM sorting domain-containing protein [Parasphingorhabdus sp.]|nr:PEPxxWA-CTERM sorting domain-containing protein [Parasphingorhabdus sp.]
MNGPSFNAPDPLLPAVGGLYDPYRIAYQFVPVGSPLPDTPPVIDPIPYNAGYVPLGAGAVPEPATWAMMIFGFGAIGAAARKRRTLKLQSA